MWFKLMEGFVNVSPKKIGVKGKEIGSQGREIINNVTKFMEPESETGIKIPITQFIIIMGRKISLMFCTHKHPKLRVRYRPTRDTCGAS